MCPRNCLVAKGKPDGSRYEYRKRQGASPPVIDQTTKIGIAYCLVTKGKPDGSRRAATSLGSGRRKPSGDRSNNYANK